MNSPPVSSTPFYWSHFVLYQLAEWKHIQSPVQILQSTMLKCICRAKKQLIYTWDMYLASFNHHNTTIYLSTLFLKPRWISVLTQEWHKYSQHKEISRFYKIIKACILNKKEIKQRLPIDGGHGSVASITREVKFIYEKTFYSFK